MYKYMVFDNNCLYDYTGELIRGPGIICIILISIVITITIVDITMISNSYIENKEYRILFDIFVGLYNVIFMFYICYNCNGLSGSIILSIINYIFYKIHLEIFGTPLFMRISKSNEELLEEARRNLLKQITTELMKK